MASSDFNRSVFVNCPFDDEFKSILKSILFCLIRFGLKPRIASESFDSGEIRLKKIIELIINSKYSIHDLSRCQSSGPDEFYRMNMPFELGLDYGCKEFGGSPFDQKRILVLEEEKHRYQKALSDMAGHDIKAHEGDYNIAVSTVRNWIWGLGGFEQIGADKVIADYEDFLKWNARELQKRGFSLEDIADLETNELLHMMDRWMSQNYKLSEI